MALEKYGLRREEEARVLFSEYIRLLLVTLAFSRYEPGVSGILAPEN